MPRHDITVTEIKDPGNFLAKECPGLNMSRECKVFNKMQDQMNAYFNNEQNFSTYPPHPEPGDVLAGKRNSDRQWYRVRVVSIHQTSKGPKASCFFIDHGQEELIPVSWLRQLPGYCQEVPEQLQTYSLWGVEPLTLATSIENDIVAKKERSKKWDISAVSFMKGLVNDSSRRMAEIVHASRGVVYVRLFLSLSDGEVCVNDLLCEKQYAAMIENPTIPQEEEEFTSESYEPKRLKKKVHTTDFCKEYFQSVLDNENGKVYSNSLNNMPKLEQVVYQRSPNCNGTIPKTVHSDSESLRDKTPLYPQQPVALSDTDVPTGLLSQMTKKPFSGGRGRVLGGEDSEKEECDSFERASISSRNSETTSTLSRGMRNLLKGETVSDSELSKKMVLGRGHSFSNVSDTEAIRGKPGQQTTSSRVQSDGDGSKSSSLASLMRAKSVGMNSAGDCSQTNSVSEAGQGYMDIFVPSRLPKCANKSSAKIGSILKKSVSSCSMNSQDSNYVRFSEALDMCAAPSGTEEWVSRKGKEVGRRLLESLSANAGQHQAPILPRTTRPDLPENKPYLGVVYHGLAKPSLITDFENLPFAELVKQTFLKKKFVGPQLIQVYGWPVVRRGRHFVGIAPPKTGKTVAYLLPLLTQLFETSPYIDLPVGNGPLALILVPSWKKAQTVYDMCREYIQERSKPRVLSIFAGGAEETQVVPLINGCEILVATPACLQRMIERRYTNLNRLCHLVLDDGEILTEVFTAEIQFIMKEYANVLRETKQQTDIPRQRIVMGSQWTKGIESFMESYLHEPVLAITSKMESAVYGKVKQIVHMVKHGNRISLLAGILEGILVPGNKIAICSSAKDEVETVHRTLRSWSHNALRYSEEMSDYDKCQSLELWNTLNSKHAPVIMVISDLWVIDSQIDDATVVIHYNLPKSKTRFGNRIALMFKYHRNFLDERQPEVSPVSHIIVTEQCTKEMRSLANFLQRSEATIPSAMTKYMAGMQMGENEDEDKEFCRHTKAFGFCVEVSMCPCRHRIIPDFDCPRGRGYEDLPRSGEVKVRISHIMDGTHYYVRLLEHRGAKKTDLSGIYVKLLMDMAHYFSDESKRKSGTLATKGEIRAIRDGHDFHRVLVLSVNESDNCRVTRSRVWYMDDGKTAEVYHSDLISLPAYLQQVPYQAVEVFLARVKPMDRDYEWTPRANSFIYEQLNDLTLDGCIVLSMGNTLWLDPLVQRKKCETIRVTTNHMRVRDELLKHGLGTNNPQHLENLYELCKECGVEVPQHLLDKYLNTNRHGQTLDTEQLLDTEDEWHEVYMSAITTPELMHIQRKENVKQFEEMIDEINEKMEKQEMEFDKELTLSPNTCCLALFSQDDRWYRAQIVEKLPGGKYEVFFCDFGDSDALDACMLRPLPDRYTGLPCQAIECRLARVSPRGDNWTNASGDALWDMTHFLTGEKKLLVAKIVSKSPACFSGCYNYTVDLYDTNSITDIHLAQELVWRRHAVSNDLQPLMPKPASPSRKLYSSPVHKLEDLCAAIYWGENDEQVVQQSKEVSALVTSQSKTASNTEAMISCGGAGAVCRLVNYLSCLEAHQHLLDALTISIIVSSRMCELAIQEGVPHKLVRCLEQSNMPVLHQQAVLAISRLVDVRCFKTALEEADVTTTLCDLLDVTKQPQIQCRAFHALASLLESSQSVSEEALKTSVCVIARDLLAVGVDHDVIEASLTFLAKMAAWENAHIELKKSAMLKAVIFVMDASQCCQCIYEAGLFCQHLTRASRKNKTILLEHELVIVLRRVLERSIDNKVRRLCEELVSAIAVTVQQSQEIIHARSLAPDIPEETSHVPVSWYQNTFRVVLVVHQSGVKKEDFSICETRVIFQSRHNGKSFDYELFEEVLPASTKIQVRTNETKVSLKKKQKGKWSRLNKQKQKPIGLTVDFERFVNSESEVSDEDVAFQLSKRSRKKLPDRPQNRKQKKVVTRTLEELESSTSTGSSDLASYSDDERKDEESFKFNYG